MTILAWVRRERFRLHGNIADLGEVVSTLGRGPAHLRRLLERLPAGFWRIASSTGWLMVGHLAQMATGVLVGIYVARYLGPQSYGVLNYAISFAFLFSVLTHLGLGDIVVPDLVRLPQRQAEILGSASLLRIASGTLALTLVAGAAWAIQADATTRLMTVVIALGFFFNAMSAPTEWFKAKVLARPVVVAGLIGMGVASVIRIGLVALGMPVVWFAWPVLIDAVLSAGLVFAFYRRHHGPPLAEWRPTIQRMRDLLSRSWPLALDAGVVQIQQRTDQVMLGEMLGPTDVGWYAAAVRLSQLWYFVPYAIATAVFPAIVRAKESSQERYGRRMQAFFDLMLWLAIAIALPATLIADPLVRFLYGDAYAPSAGVLQIHIWSLMFTSLAIAGGPWMVVEGLTRVALTFSIVSVLTNISLNLLLIPSYGAVGAAWATLAASAPVVVLRFVYRPTRPLACMMLRAASAPIRRSIGT